ncbi:hypothetical protein GOODEAATRI_001024, partial [Goodea atripinnis]
YKKSLEEAIHSDTSGHFCRILVSLVQVTILIMRTQTVHNFHAHSLCLCLTTDIQYIKVGISEFTFDLICYGQGAREEGPADVERACADAQELADACNAESDDMEMKFMSILCTRSFPHLRRVFQEFVKCTNKDIEQIIKKEMSGDVKNAFYGIVRSVKNQPSYFSDRLYKAMKGLGTDDRALIRIMVSRSEVDLFNIRKEFKETHDVSLHEFIQGDTSGDYRKTLLILCGGED